MVTHLRSPRFRIGFLLTTFAVLHFLPFPWTTLILDGARDVSYALAIADGREFPLRGPLINETLHLGPVWFYALSLPLIATRSLTALSLFIGALAALKFPLAYAIGRRLHGERAGLLFCVALAIPGWESGSLLVASHISVIETAVLICAYTLSRLHVNGNRWWWLAYGAAQGLALHAHPATVLCSLLVPVVLVGRRSFVRDMVPLLAGALASTIWFLPMIWAEYIEGWPALARMASLLQAPPQHSYSYWERVFAVATAAWFDPPALLGGWLLPSGLSVPLHVAYAILFGLALFGLVTRLCSTSTRNSTVLLVTMACTAMLVLVTLRERTPHYMLLCWIPFQAACIALGWSAFHRSMDRPLIAIVSVLVIGNTWGWIHIASNGIAEVPSARLFDVGSRSTDTLRSENLPVWVLDHLSEELCTETRPVVLHGPMALLFDVSGAVGMQSRCPERLPHVGIGGGTEQENARHLLGLTPEELRLFGIDSDWQDAITRNTSTVLGSESSLSVAFGPAYPFREVDRSARRIRTFEAQLAAGTRVLAGMPLAPYGGGVLVNVKGPEGVLVPSLESVGSRIYVIPTDGRWIFQCQTGTRGDCDLVTF